MATSYKKEWEMTLNNDARQLARTHNWGLCGHRAGWALLLGSLIAGIGCGDDGLFPIDAVAPLDFSVSDAASQDSGSQRDAESFDSGSQDAGSQRDAESFDSGADDAGAMRRLRILMTGGSGTSVHIESVDRSVEKLCSNDCEVFASADSGGFVVTLRSTRRDRLFTGFRGACTVQDDLRECHVSVPEGEVTVATKPSGAPPATGRRWLGSMEDDWLRSVAVDAAGNRYGLASVRGLAHEGDSFFGEVFIGQDAAGAVRFVRPLPHLVQREVKDIAVDPAGTSIWIAAICTGDERFDGMTRSGVEGVCVARYAPNGDFIELGGWPGDAYPIHLAVGTDGTVALMGGINASVSWDGHSLSRRDGNQFIARLQPSPMTMTFVQVVANGATDLGSSLAVAPTGDIYVAGHVRGRTQVGPLDIDIANFQYSAYLLRYSSTGNLLDATGLGSTSVARVAAISATATTVYVAGTYNGQLNIGNTTSRDARGILHYPYVARLDAEPRLPLAPRRAIQRRARFHRSAVRRWRAGGCGVRWLLRVGRRGQWARGLAGG